MDQELIREIAIEITELKTEFDSRMSALNRKLKIALGDVEPCVKTTEFLCRNGKVRPIRKQGERK
jgi:hypothetical protein